MSVDVPPQQPISEKPNVEKPGTSALSIDRRRFLKYVGTGASAMLGAATLGTAFTQLGCAPAARGAWVRADGRATWRSPAYPVPLPGDDAPRSEDRRRLARFEVIDDLTLPEGFRYDVIARWGESFGEGEHRIDFGYNNDYTGLLPIPGTDDEYWLFVNHEYVSYRPFAAAHESLKGEALPVLAMTQDPRTPPLAKRGILSIDGEWSALGNRVDLTDEAAMAAIPEEIRARMKAVSERILDQMGVSILRARRLEDGRFEVIRDAKDHRRITAHRRQNVVGEPASHSRFSGPAAAHFETPPRGTMSNCSGGTTPWGTFLTCEENFHNSVAENVTPAGRPIPGQSQYWGGRVERVGGVYLFDDPVPTSIDGAGYFWDLDGREYGWVAEVDPATGAMSKHTALGRFRHENVTLRCEAGKPLAAYMGDDRRGGHVWKFVSDGRARDPADPGNGRLLESGTLYVARFLPDYTGEWVPIDVDTPLRAPQPEFCHSQHIQVPSRFVGGAVSVGDTDRDNPDLEVDAWISIVEKFTGKPFDRCTLGDLVTAEGESEDEIRERKRGVLLMDAFLMANACGGTPAARPEDLEVHPGDGSVYIAFTDHTDGGDGSPDFRIFKDSRSENSRQYGAIFRIVEDRGENGAADPAARSFTWGRFVESGEVAEKGGGFACADNLVFDPSGNIWMVTDISTTAQNFPTARQSVDGTDAGGKYFPGVFGNNAMFMIPTEGRHKALPQLFAIAPMDAELCGPTFSEDGETLILSVQHPGEGGGVRTSAAPSQTQKHTVHDRDDQPFEQTRTVPAGSNFPHGERDQAPVPAVVCITRRA
ncbi:MAG: alkaline phosphatase PhoX [Acidobacteriota bacterium]